MKNRSSCSEKSSTDSLFLCGCLQKLQFSRYLGEVMQAVAEVLTGVVILVNLCSYSLFAWDKRQAQRSGWRVAERHLLLSALAGGCAGAWVAVWHCRHKRRKPAFLAWLLGISLVHFVLVIAVIRSI